MQETHACTYLLAGLVEKNSKDRKPFAVNYIFFSCEVRSSLRITLIEKEATISDDLKNKFQILLLIKLMRQIASIVSK